MYIGNNVEKYLQKSIIALPLIHAFRLPYLVFDFCNSRFP